MFVPDDIMKLVCQALGVDYNLIHGDDDDLSDVQSATESRCNVLSEPSPEVPLPLGMILKLEANRLSDLPCINLPIGCHIWLALCSPYQVKILIDGVPLLDSFPSCLSHSSLPSPDNICPNKNSAEGEIPLSWQDEEAE